MMAPSTREKYTTVLILWAIFCLLSSGVAPDVNEAHYLSKAKHYWNPEWCRDDFFLNSADAHLVFYWLYGWTTCCLPMALVAYLGRLLACLHFAWAWERLAHRLIPGRAAAIVSAAVTALGVGWFDLSGEWVWGGLEAKSFSFPWVIMALTNVVVGEWRYVWIWLGLATAWHPLVGGWAALSIGGVWLLAGMRVNTLMPTLGWMVLGAAVASIGIIPALALTSTATSEMRQIAAEIYVHARLSHHLIPTAFGTLAWCRFLLLLAIWWLLWWQSPPTAPHRRFHGVVAGSVGIALIGLLVYAATWRDPALSATWMRYYWFRWADVAVPCGVAFGTVNLAHENRLNLSRRLCVWGCIGIAAGLLALVGDRWSWSIHAIPAADRQALRMVFRDAPWQRAAHARWKDACNWIAGATPTDAVFLTPRCQQTFRWYGQRAELVNWKDIPQDAAGIVEWWSRYRQVYTRDSAGIGAPYVETDSRKTITAIAQRFSAQYAVVFNRDTLQLPAELAVSPHAPPEPNGDALQVSYFNDIFVVVSIPRASRPQPAGLARPKTAP